MRGTVASLWRHPVKGLTPERLAAALLRDGDWFPHDREYAIEVGPSGFDPKKPEHISKNRFTVLARFPSLARLRTWLDEDTGVFHIGDAHGFGVETNLTTPEGREALETFLQMFLGDEASGKLRVLDAPARHAFTDSPKGFVSVINLASIRAVEQAIGQPVDPLRFRANVYVEGWPAWMEDRVLTPGKRLALGEADLDAIKPIERCVATHVSTETGMRDIDMVEALRTHFGRVTMGTYFSIARGGWVVQDTPAEVL